MPYIGQRPATGEHNSFKILDDISNYTLTFGSSDIDTSADTITAREHRFVTGQRVTYGNGGGTDPTGLSNGTVYYIIVEDRHTFKLATNASNAVAGTAIDITAAGAGAAHTINVAFDGVNTKFKATHTNGTKADISQSGQLMVSVNGVLQQPHDNTTTPTTGYATDHTSTIIFSAAPAAGDQFFGRLIASNFATFDISDNTVDNFTGDGNTSTFTLSKAPPNNESILVTIDGVVQYPDDNAAVRAYTVSENVLDFASAPGNAVEIQVRHIGFAGASTGGISGFYGRTGNAVLKNTDNIVFNNATAGIVTATNITVTGNLTVDGTTTTLDTELVGVDKLEVSANNTTSAGIITQTGSGDILNLYDGSTEVFSVTDGGRVLIGTQTEGDSSADNLTIADSGNSGITIRSGTSNQGSIFFSDATSGSGEYDGFIQYSQNDRWLKFGTATSTRLTITSAGNIGIGSVIPAANIDVQRSGTGTIARFGIGDGTTNLDIKYSSNTTTFDQQHGKSIAFETGSAERLRITSSGSVGIGTDNPATNFKLDVNGDLSLGELGGSDNTYIDQKQNGQINIINSGRQSNSGGVRINKTNSIGGDTTYFRDFEVYDGKDNLLLLADGSSGNIGINETSPVRKLHAKADGAPVARFERDTNDGEIIEVRDFNNNQIGGFGSDTGDLTLSATNSNNLRIESGGTERLRIDSSGRLGLGVVPEAFHSNNKSCYTRR